MDARRLAIAGIALSLGAVQAPPGTEDPAPTWSHPAPGAPTLTRFSQAVIRRWGADYIRISYFVDPIGLKRRNTEDPMTWLRTGHVWSGTRLTFLTGISGEKRRSVFDAQFQRLWPGGHFDPHRPTIQHFFEVTSRRLNRGDHLDYLLDPAGTVRVRHGDEPWTAIKDRELILALLGLNYIEGTDNPETNRAIAMDLERFAQTSP